MHVGIDQFGKKTSAHLLDNIVNVAGNGAVVRLLLDYGSDRGLVVEPLLTLRQLGAVVPQVHDL